MGTRENTMPMQTRAADQPRPREAVATVVSRTMLARDVVSLTLALPDGTRWPWRAGDHIDVEVPGGPIRQYSLCGPVEDTSRLTIAVLLEARSRGGSSYLHAVTEGEPVHVRGPRNNFPLVPADAYRFVAGGIGITPILAMIREAETHDTPWTLLYGGRSRDSMAFLDELLRYGDRVRVVAEDEQGRPPLDEWLADPAPAALVYCCGPAGLLDAVERRCETWPRGSLHVERFTPRDVETPVLEEPFEVELARTGTSVVVEPGTSILEAVARAGVPMLSSCQEGTCGTCETAVLAGIPEHRDSVLDDDEQAANDCMMICVSRSRTPRLVLDL
ncbi:PDR/VanB family oxidoreductase [Dactylosporangium sp. CA-092794]|uniref:PDR/VanB family oxidoreductase n=1 Tax=Dactylosporangium sp. CA-092794 TaxID=3239929 RepID=UPI003D8A4DCA